MQVQVAKDNSILGDARNFSVKHVLESVPLIKGQIHFKTRPQNRILVPLTDSFQNFSRALTSSFLNMTSWASDLCRCLLLRLSSMSISCSQNSTFTTEYLLNNLIPKIPVSMVTVSHIVEMYPWRSQVTRARPGLPSVLIDTKEHQTTFLNWTMLAMHAGTLVVRPLTVLGATLPIGNKDGSTAAWKSVKHTMKAKVCLWRTLKV